MAGVLNNLGRFAPGPVFLTTDRIPTVDPAVETHIIRPGPGFRDFIELPHYLFSSTFADKARAALGDRRPALVYQRMSLGSCAGLRLARECGVPFVLEYNGSDVWIARNWGAPLVYESLAERVETANLHGADLVVTVSAAMRDTITARGVDPAKILVNPNGVDPEAYSPRVDGTAVRQEYGLEGRLVFGFIGTFGKWHGAEVLARAFVRLLELRPDLGDTARLLYIGDGMTLPETKALLDGTEAGARTTFTGIVPQARGPAHLAACDVLVSPHVPNPDGTPFFGSPTKLFEYMAMGKAIAASNLDQIGEVLEHGRTAWMARPGDADDLARAMAALADDADLRARLGAAARQRAVERHTWLEHTRRIVEALRQRCPSD